MILFATLITTSQAFELNPCNRAATHWHPISVYCGDDCPGTYLVKFLLLGLE